MPNNYLLPCDCGNSLTVETSQAGKEVTCTCGRLLTVPSLRAIRQLRPAFEKPQAMPTGRTRAWNPLKGLTFAFGAVLILTGLLVAAYSYSIYSQAATFRPSTEQYDQSLETIDNMAPVDLLESFNFVKEHGLEEAGSSPFAQAQMLAEQKLRWTIAALAVAAVGILATVVPLFVGGR